jgi:glycosyltransferase involved in cell wall biosynthesis
VFILDFDGGFLRRSPLEFLELPLLRLARRPVIAIPYGSDVIDVRRCPDERTREALLRDYPELERLAASTARRVRHYGRWASFVICGGSMGDYTPRCDLLLPSCLAIDADEWRATRAPPAEGPVRVLHAPNHRAIKGTEHVVDACRRLAAEGLPVELVLLEGVPNQEIRRTIEDVHVVASAFVMGYYELFAVEGMSMSRPVLNYWRPDLKRLHTERSFAGECPIVDAPIDELADRIRELVIDSGLRARLGEEGRRYVERRHSYEAMGAVLADVVRTVWAR